MAFSKMVGFEVTPRRSSSSIFFCRSPDEIIARRMLSYQMDWPSCIISVRRLLISHLPERTFGGLRASPVLEMLGAKKPLMLGSWNGGILITQERGGVQRTFGTRTKSG